MSQSLEEIIPDTNTLISIGSALIHAEEYLSDDGHWADKIAFDSIMSQENVKEWIKQMNELALLPAKRKQ